MHWWQWAAYAVLMVIVVTLFDGCFRVLLQGDVTVTKLEGKRNHDTLIVYLPGLVADGEWSARQQTETWRDFGDVWLVNPTGDRFEHEQLADTVAKMLQTDDHKQVVFIGSSLGADSALDVMSRISKRKRANVEYDLIPVCTPSGGVSSIKQPLKAVSVLAAAFRLGPLTNVTWGKYFTRSITGEQPRTFAMTYYIDQVNYVRSRENPPGSLLNEFDKIVYVQALNDELVSPSAAKAWVASDLDVVQVNSKHVAYDADPEVWNSAFTRALNRVIKR